MASPRANITTKGVFLAQSHREREAAPKVARALMLLLFSFLFFAVIWAANTSMRELVRAEGEIAPYGELRRVDHFDGGIISELYVAAGASVAMNQPLARIEHPNLDSQIAELEAELTALNRDISNTTWLLEGEAAGEVSAAVEARRRLFIAQQEIMKHRIARFAEATDVAAALRKNAKDHLSLSETSLNRLQMLHDRGVISEARLLLQAEEAASVRADFFRAEADHSQTTMDAVEAASEKEEERLAFQEEHLKTLSELERSRILLEVRLNSLSAQKGRQVVRAPESGVIQSSVATTVGEVVPPGGLLFELLPSDERLVAVARIDPKDVGHIQEGSDVILKLTTFDARRYGEVRGSIELISPTSIVPDQGPAYYKAIFSLDRNTVGEGANVRRLRAGMTLSAEIETSKRSVLKYLLKPVQNAFDRSLSER